jgi:hypothetical protein
VLDHCDQEVGMSVTYFCNHCGAAFTPFEPGSRFCSRACGIRANCLWPTERLRVKRRQRECLDVLARSLGSWVPVEDIVSALYGVDDHDARHALRMVVARLHAKFEMHPDLQPYRVEARMLDVGERPSQIAAYRIVRPRVEVAP